MRIYVPRDAAARALGADAVARAVADEARRRGIEVELVRNGTRGMIWLEPLVEVETGAGRTGFGPVAAADVPGLFDAGFGVASAGARAGRGDPVLRPADPADLRPLRADRPAVAGGLRGARRPRGAAPGAGAWTAPASWPR